jgi:hypothetical protein
MHDAVGIVTSARGLRTGALTSSSRCRTRPRKNWKESFRCTIDAGPLYDLQIEQGIEFGQMCISSGHIYPINLQRKRIFALLAAVASWEWNITQIGFISWNLVPWVQHLWAKIFLFSFAFWNWMRSSVRFWHAVWHWENCVDRTICVRHNRRTRSNLISYIGVQVRSSISYLALFSNMQNRAKQPCMRSD